MATLETTLIHLAPAQKRKLSQLAKRKQTSVASEVRNAIDCYFVLGAEGINPTELAEAAKSAQQAVANMTAHAKKANHQLEAALRDLRKPKRKAS